MAQSAIATCLPAMLILLDMDGVLADFEHAFLAAWRERHPDLAPVEYEDRQSFYIQQDYPAELRPRVDLHRPRLHSQPAARARRHRGRQ